LWGDSVKAIIMAGGEGSRLRPLTCDLPKPMVSIMNKPVMEHTIDLLKQYGITDIGITLMYHPQLIKDYFGNGTNLGVNITYFIEETPLGTAGGIKSAQGFLDEPFIVISGDSITNLNITKAIEFHKQKNSIATLILTKVDLPLDYGVVLTNDDGSITGFLEKPSWGEIFSDTVNTGTYIFEPEIFDYIEPNKNTDFSRDVFPSLLLSSKNMFGYTMSDYWCDIGDIRSYVKSHCDIFDKKIKIGFEGTQIKENVWVGAGTVIESNAEINAPCIIGSNCKIGNGTLIDNYTIIGNNTIIEDDVSIVRSIIWDNCYVEYGSELRGAILCNRVNLKHYVSVFENAVIGEGCRINERVIVKPDIKIWPEKIIEPFAIIDRNMIWGSKHSNKVFGENGISGIINVDISPEFATRLGAAYGSQFKIGSRVVVSSTNSNSARMFKHAFISGILSVGIEVYNMSSLLTPIARAAIGFLAVEGGIHIKTDVENENMVRVDFMDARGASISRFSERKIENSFFKEDFKRCSAEQISRLNNITDFSNYYMRSINSKADINLLKEKNIKVCIFSRSEFVLSIVISILTDLGCTATRFLYDSKNDLDYVASHIIDTGSDFAAIIDKNGESLILVDKTGEVIKDDLFQAFISLIIFKTSPKSTFFVPITGSEVIDKLALKYNGTVKRTKNSSQAIMDEILNDNIGRNPEQLILNFDAIAGLINIIEYICISDATLSQIVSEIPNFFIIKKSIHCPWELKGTVMRTIINEQKGKKIELLDGIKLYSNQGWVLIMPDADKPIFKIISESYSSIESEALCDKYYNQLERIIGNN
jgi:mannose-1-phosphate guanylyltransferase / phosphomannomutase